MFTVQDRNIICEVLKYALILISVHLIEKKSRDRCKTKQKYQNIITAYSFLYILQ